MRAHTTRRSPAARGWGLVDLSTRLWWRLVGRPVDLAADRWLVAPTSATAWVGTGWIDAGWIDAGTTQPAAPTHPGPQSDAGLLASFDDLASPEVAPDEVHPLVRHFYEHTAAWDMDVNLRWSVMARPAGWLIHRFFGRRVQQLALPVRATSAGELHSQVTPLRDASGHQVAAAWVRTLTPSGETVFSGWYHVGWVPTDPHPVVHVAFPLPSGNLQVFLRPRVHPDGSFTLTSGPGRFGDAGTYVHVRVAGRDHVARVPLHEQFHVYVDAAGTLRTDHTLRLGRFTALRLEYRMRRAA